MTVRYLPDGAPSALSAEELLALLSPYLPPTAASLPALRPTCAGSSDGPVRP